MKSNIVFSSNSDEWSTPKDVFESLNEEFKFNLDPCATESNHKTERYFTQKENGLEKCWGGAEYFAIHHIAIYLNG